MKQNETKLKEKTEKKVMGERGEGECEEGRRGVKRRTHRVVGERQGRKGVEKEKGKEKGQDRKRRRAHPVKPRVHQQVRPAVRK